MPNKQQVDLNDNFFGQNPVEPDLPPDDFDVTKLTDEALDFDNYNRFAKATNSAITTVADGSVQVGSFHFLKTGLVINGNISRKEWKQAGAFLLNLEGAVQWLIGDWLAYGERTYKTTYKDVAAETGRDVDTLYNYTYVARKIDFSLRNEKLSFNHHYAVAKLTPDKQYQYLTTAEGESLSVSELRKLIAVSDSPAPTRQVKPATEIKRAKKAVRTKIADLAGRVGRENRSEISQMLRELADNVDAGRI